MKDLNNYWQCWFSKISIAFLLLIAFAMTCQRIIAQPVICGVKSYNDALGNRFYANKKLYESNYIKTFRNEEKSYRKFLREYTIPVVVHIVHQNGPENISDTQIQETLEAFNALLDNEGSYYYEDNIEIDIDLCLARRTPENEMTSGINRIESPLTNVHMIHTDGTMKGLGFWDTRKYLNIWIVREISGDNINPAGYATMPWFHGLPMDGIVIEARYFENRPDRLQILAHEFGHYLGLHHTFLGGCRNDDCLTDGDRVCDTPPDNSRSATPCASSNNTCLTDEDDTSSSNPFRSNSSGGQGDQPDMIENHMDYGYPQCQYKFTQGQKERMHFFLGEFRGSLIKAKSCLEPCPLQVSGRLVASDTIAEVGASIDLMSESNATDRLEWRIDGVLVSQDSLLNYTFDSEGSYRIELILYSDDARCDSLILNREIEIFCPVQASMEFNLNQDTLHMNNTSNNELSHEFRLLNHPDRNILISSGQDNIEYELETPGTYQICIVAEEQNCRDTLCEYFVFYGEEQEDCNLAGDEDGDGLIDGFDQDCACNNELYYGQCEVNCEVIPSEDSIQIRLKWVSPVLGVGRSEHPNISFQLGDVDGDGNVEIVAYTFFYDENPSGFTVETPLYTIDASTGQIEKDITALPLNYPRPLSIGLADLDLDGEVDVFFQPDSTVAQTINGELKFIERDDPSNGFGFIEAADFNEDGLPELYHSRFIMNGQTGKNLVRGYDGVGSGDDRTIGYLWGNSIAADVLPHPGLELITGNTVYEVSIINTQGSSGNVLNAILPSDETVLDGFPGIGDFDLDGNLDVVSVNGVWHGSDPSGIWLWNPRSREVMAHSDYSGTWGGMPTIGDLDNDCIPEIVCIFQNTLIVFQFDGTKELKILFEKSIAEESGRMGVTVFDLNQDGSNEIIYRDENELVILEGHTGNKILTYPLPHLTGFDRPIIADIDGDAQAEIVVEGYLNNSKEVHLFAFESAGAPWAPARPVWNQYAYHSTNINDDLTVPRVQQNMAKPLQGHEDCLRETCPTPYNGFLVQSTYRTQAGCVQFPAVDLSVEALGYDCGPDSTTFYLQVCNGSNGKSVREEYCISLYDGLSSPGYSEVFCLNQQVDTMGCSDTMELRIPTPGSLDQLYFAVNDDGSAASPAAFPITNLVECNYQNNIDMLDLDISPRSLDLGPDLSKCESEVMTLEAPSGFERYLWSDLTWDSLYSSAAEGIHWLEATDQCGRVYRDTVVFSIDRQDELNLPDEFTGCPGDSIGLLVNGSDYESIQWFPSGAVACDTCFVTSLFIQDSITELIGVTQNGACVYVDTIVLQPTVGIEIEQTAEICEGDSLRYFDQIASEAGTYRYTTADCDSSFVLDLETLENSAFSYQEEICKGDSVLFDGLWRFTEGKYTQMLTAANGCDSMVTLELELLPQDSTSRSEALCEGDTLQVAGEKYTQAGDYELRALNQFGCDSLIRLSLAVYDKDTLSLEREYCSGDSLLFDGRWYANPDTYELMYENSYGCDSLVRLQVTEVDTLKEQAEYLLCPGDSVEVAGQWIDQSGVYPFALTSLAGCDSSFTAEVEVLLAPEPPTTEIDCEAGLAILSLPENALWGVLWDNGDTSWVTQYNASGRVEAIRSADSGCRIVQEVDIPSLPEVRFLPQFSDTLLDYNESLLVSAG